MLAELLTGLVGLVPPAVKYVGGVIGSEVLDRRARRLENEYGGLFEGDDVKLIGDIGSVSALLARFDAIAGKIEAPKKTQSSIVSGILAAAVFYAVVTFIWSDVATQTATMYLLAVLFASLALGTSWVWDWAFSALNVFQEYTVVFPKRPDEEELTKKPGVASYRRARADLHKQMLTQMAGLMDQLAGGETLRRYASETVRPRSADARDDDGNLYPRYGAEVADIIDRTPALKGTESALAYVVSQRENSEFEHRPLVLAHCDKVYIFSFDADRGIDKPPKIKDAIDFEPGDVGQKVWFWRLQPWVSIKRWRKHNIDVHSDDESTFWLPPEIKFEAPEPEVSKGPSSLDYPR